MNKLWPPLVREVTQTVDHPGYRYDFFRTFKELDQYFTQLCGPDWLEQPWAKFWLGQHNMSRTAFRRELAARRGEDNGYGAYMKVDDATFLILVKKARSEGVRISCRKLSRYLKERGYGVSWRSISRMMRRHNITRDERTMDVTTGE